MTNLTIEQRDIIQIEYTKGNLLNKYSINELANKLNIHRNSIVGIISMIKCGTVWTNKDLQYLKENMNKKTIKEIAGYLNRSTKTVFERIRCMGWKRTKNFSSLFQIKEGQHISTKTEFKEGRVPNNKNKTYEEIYGKERAKQIKDKAKKNRGYVKAWNIGLTKDIDKRIKKYGNSCSQTKNLKEWKETKGQNVVTRMRENNPAKYCKNPSKPQLNLFEEKEKVYGKNNVFINHKVPKLNGGYYYLDVAVPSTMEDFEYDGEYWHSLTKDKDKERDSYLKGLGWNIIRVTGLK